MSAKLVHYDIEARDALKKGVDKLANAVKLRLALVDAMLLLRNHSELQQ